MNLAQTAWLPARAILAQLAPAQRAILGRIAQAGCCSVLSFPLVVPALAALHLLVLANHGTEYHLSPLGWQVVALVADGVRP